MTRRLRDEPLLHFALSGLVLFALSRLAPAEVDEGVVEVSSERARRLFSAFEEQQGRPPNADESQRILSVAVDSEILRREARRLGFDRSDPVVQRRLSQKMRFALEGRAQLDEVSDADLQGYLDAHVESFMRPATASFEHVFIAKGSPRMVEFDELGERLRSGDDPKALGEPFNPGRIFEARGREELVRQFGIEFAEGVLGAPEQSWTALESTLGSHWVRVTDRRAARPPRLAEVRVRVTEAWRQERREATLKHELEKLRERYEVHLPALEELAP